MQVGIGPDHIVLDGNPAPFPQRGTPPKFSSHICCGQMSGWIKMPLGMEVGLSPSDFVLDEDPAPIPKGGGAPAPIFGPFLLWPNGWMHQDTTWYAGRPRPRRLCVRWEPSYPQRKGTPSFWPMSIVATVAHLSYCWAVVNTEFYSPDPDSNSSYLSAMSHLRFCRATLSRDFDARQNRAIKSQVWHGTNTAIRAIRSFTWSFTWCGHTSRNLCSQRVSQTSVHEKTHPSISQPM